MFLATSKGCFEQYLLGIFNVQGTCALPGVQPIKRVPKLVLEATPNVYITTSKVLSTFSSPMPRPFDGSQAAVTWPWHHCPRNPKSLAMPTRPGLEWPVVSGPKRKLAAFTNLNNNGVPERNPNIPNQFLELGNSYRFVAEMRRIYMKSSLHSPPDCLRSHEARLAAFAFGLGMNWGDSG